MENHCIPMSTMTNASIMMPPSAWKRHSHVPNTPPKMPQPPIPLINLPSINPVSGVRGSFRRATARGQRASIIDNGKAAQHSTPVPIHSTTPTPPSPPPIRTNFITPLTNTPGNIAVPGGRVKLPRVAARCQRSFGCNWSSLGPPLQNHDPPSFPTSQQASKALSTHL